MVVTEQGHLLRIYVGEADKHEDGLPVYEWILRAAQQHGIAGATVLRGLGGFGARGQLHTVKFLRLATHLPVVIEIVDLRERIDSFLPLIDGAIADGLATIEKVEIRRYMSTGETGE